VDVKDVVPVADSVEFGERYLSEGTTIDVAGRTVCFSASQGAFEVAKRVVCWADNSPRVVTARLTNRVAGEVVLENAWRRGADGIDAGLRYAGMVVTVRSPSQWPDDLTPVRDVPRSGATCRHRCRRRSTG
jgi:hypothetical protein